MCVVRAERKGQVARSRLEFNHSVVMMTSLRVSMARRTKCECRTKHRCSWLRTWAATWRPSPDRVLRNVSVRTPPELVTLCLKRLSAGRGLSARSYAVCRLQFRGAVGCDLRRSD